MSYEDVAFKYKSRKLSLRTDSAHPSSKSRNKDEWASQKTHGQVKAYRPKENLKQDTIDTKPLNGDFDKSDKAECSRKKIWTCQV
ncbi:hypothetical protein GCK72_020195 [Caenorhabditis remanei]|uniref:Uncharacterized protein n=2 Tax=Caenorhabditis remanei TaxID=31234 RepID=A0A6A5GEN5_CAERE|nr:hypothetical protein GCK72_020195 [Caenorhabditis remanei]KAF1753638.1 hypothetical protein GCK72_020195 [Caenorhabditis remanei]